ncbi:MAG: arylsulfatase [Caldilineaceae bacterium]
MEIERTQLPIPEKRFAGTLGQTADKSKPDKPAILMPPEGAPNVFVVLLDDVGFAASDVFGGPVPMPALRQVADEGLRYNQFHTTALCSPTRAALLTGRNHHSVHFGTISEIAMGFPGYDSVIPKSKASVGAVLTGNGYNTAFIGKNHVTPMWEMSPAGPFDRWPTGLGFERFYGFMGGEASQWEPSLLDQTVPVNPHVGKENYHLTEDLADKTIAWIQSQKTSAPDKPFMVYFAPGAAHAPHHAPKAWIEKFKGQFDQGWDELRAAIFQRQLEAGVIPAGTTNTPRPGSIPSWDEYPDRYKPVAARLMEVFAAFLAHTDAQVGRVIEVIKEMGQWENTLFLYIVGDNGSSAEGTIHGTWSSPAMQNGFPEDPEWLLEHIEELGSAAAENHYNVGWAWALDCPFQWTKQVASHFGGTRNAMAVAWPRKIKDAGGLRSQFHHVIDIMPTILEAAGIPHPHSVGGVEQEPIEGVSMLYTFDSASAPSTRRTQYFEILANRAIYHEGWVAACFHGRPPWVRSQKLEIGGPQEKWELYNIEQDFSEGQDLAADNPAKVKELQALFEQEAWKYNVYPLSGETLSRSLPFNRPSLIAAQKKFTFYRSNVHMPEMAIVSMKNRSFVMTAHLEIPAGGAEGVVVCQGGNLAGWSLYVQDNKPVYYYNWLGHEMYAVKGAEALPAGPVELTVKFDYDGGGLGKGGSATLLVNGTQVAQGRIEKTVPFVFSMSGETFDVGEDTGAPVGPYPHVFPFTGKIGKIDIEVASMLAGIPEEKLNSLLGEGMAQAALAAQ